MCALGKLSEIHVGKGMQNQQFLTIVRDLQSGAVIHVGEGKGCSALAGALKKLKKSINIKNLSKMKKL